MSRPWIFLCPSSRGIGHALTRHLLLHTHPSIPILATARSADLSKVKSAILKGLPSSSSSSSSTTTTTNSLDSRLHLVQADVTSEESIKAASEEATRLFPHETHHLHLSFALPGVLYPEKSYSAIDYHHALETFQVNVLGPMLLMKWFGGFLPRKNTTFLRTTTSTTDGKDGGAEEEEIIQQEGHHESDKTPPSSAAGSAGGYGGCGEPVGSLSSSSPNSNSHPNKKTNNGHGKGKDTTGKILKLLPPHATWTTMSARVGSVTDNKLGGWYSYRSSKAAVNSLTKSLDFELKTKSANKALAISYHPGTVKTGLSKEFWESVANDSLFAPEDAADKMAQVILGLRVSQRGRCWDWKGEEVPP